MGKLLITANDPFRFSSPNPLDLAEVCAAAGLEVTVAAPFTDESRDWHQGRGFLLERLVEPGGQVANRRYWSAALQVARRLRPDVILGVNPVGWLAADLARGLGLAKSAAYYALELVLPRERPTSLSVRYQAFRARRAALVVTTGEERAFEMQQAFQLPEKPLVVANSPLRGPGGRSAALREQLALSGPVGRTILLYAGSAGVPNSLEEAVAASQLWRADCTLAIQAFGGSAEERRHLEKAVAASSGRARLVPSVPGGRDALLAWISGADLGLVLYDHHRDRSRNMLYYTPNKLFDYMSCGLPVVASDNPPLVREVEQRGWGLCCRPSDPASIASAVDRAVAGYDRFAERARLLFESEYRYPLQSRPVVERLLNLAR